MNWDSPILFIDTYTGAICFVIFLFTYFFPPKSINSIYGYRTKRSMQSQRNWDFSQKYSSRKMLRSTAILVLFGLVGLFIDLQEGLEVGIGMLLLIFALFHPIYLTEKALKKYEADEESDRVR
ncbi:MAG: SdpI family protein [Vicingaceae bacterium]